MNKDIIIERDEAVIASEINYIKRRTCETVLANSVEIGRLLCEAKDKVAPGAWMEWLSDNVNYSQSTANNLMNLYREYGEQQQIGFFEENRLEIFGDLTPSQALALLPLPYAERKQFVEEHDMSETSVRDIQALVKAQKDAEKEADDLRQELEEQKTALEGEIDELKKKLDELEQEPFLPDIEEERARIEAELKAEYEEKIAKVNKKLEKIKKEKDDANADKEAAEARLEGAKAAAAEEAKAALETEYSERLQQAEEEKKALMRKALAAGSADVQKFGVHFTLFQQEGQELISALRAIREQDEAVSERLKDGLLKAIDIIKEGIEA